MVAVDDCEADADGFGLGAFEDGEEFAVAAGAPDDFLGAHVFVFLKMLVGGEVMFSCFCGWVVGFGPARKRVED